VPQGAFFYACCLLLFVVVTGAQGVVDSGGRIEALY